MSSSREARYKRIAQQAQRKFRRLSEAIPDVEALMSDHESGQAKIKTLTERVYRHVWERAMLDAGADPSKLDDLYKLAGPEIGDDDPDPERIAKGARKALKARPEFVKGDDSELDDDEGDGQDDDDDDAPVKTVFDVTGKGKGKAKAKPRAAEQADDEGDEDDDDEQPAPKGKGKSKGEAQAPRLSRGEGAGRGRRENPKPPTIDEQIQAEFAAAGRSDPGKI